MNNHIFNFSSNSYSQFLTFAPDKQIDITLDEENSNTYQYIYLTQKKVAWFHQLIFFGFAFIFFILGSVVYLNTTNWACSLYFSNCAFIKNAVYITSYSFAVITIAIGLFSKPERETAYYLFRKMEKKLKTLYRGPKRQIIFSFSIEARLKKLFFKQTYAQSIEKMRDYKEQTLLILDRIQDSKELGNLRKEELINQALYDFQKALQSILQSFNRKILPR